mmetsp:Transcript_9479/g.27322  ORF Transcript_9479/g.27322 Transcript_9479/m.27322 type:complete len:307 (+) Transcript_9479:2950-3870(+)
MAHEKSKRSLMFVDTAVRCNVRPICSAIPMNRLLYKETSTGSAIFFANATSSKAPSSSSSPSLPASTPNSEAFLLEEEDFESPTTVISRSPASVIKAIHPGSMRHVDVPFIIIAGPMISSRGYKSSNSYTGVSVQPFSPSKYVFVFDFCRCSKLLLLLLLFFRISALEPLPPDTFKFTSDFATPLTRTSSTIASRFSITNPYSARKRSRNSSMNEREGFDFDGSLTIIGASVPSKRMFKYNSVSMTSLAKPSSSTNSRVTISRSSVAAFSNNFSFSFEYAAKHAVCFSRTTLANPIPKALKIPEYL